MAKFMIEDDNLERKNGDESRAPRDASDVQRQDQDGTVLSRSERRRLFRDEWTQQVLPQPPEIPGYHCCWLSSTSTYDPIHKRIRMGYEPVKASEVVGFDFYNLKSGEWKGFIGVNEMLLFKIPQERYQMIMEELHYYQPLEQEQMLKQAAVQQQQDSEGNNLVSVEGDGLDALGRELRVPTFD